MRQLKIQKNITNRSSEALDKYLVEIGRAPLISIDEEIGDKLNLTRERVRQIREKSISKLRDSGNAKILMKYLG